MKKIQILSIMILTFFLVGCNQNNTNTTNTSKTTQNTHTQQTTSDEIKLGGIHLNISIKNKQNEKIEVIEAPLSKELKDYIINNIPAHKDQRFLAELDSKSITWIDFKEEKTKQYNAPFDDKYTAIANSTISPDGKYIAMNLTKGKGSKWSKLILIDTETNTYKVILDDEILLTPKENCEKIEVVTQRNKEDLTNECLVNKPQSVYLLEKWTDNNTLEITKEYYDISATTYTLDVT